jgi:hypothetical protein
MANPFTLRVIPPFFPFCNRTIEIQQLSSHADNKANVVLFSPRRYGKTSLIRKLQSDLSDKGFFTVYVDFFMATSESEIARRISQSIYSVLHARESLLDKGVRFLKTFKTFRPVFKPSPESGFSFSVEPVSSAISGIDLIDNVMEELGLFIRRESINAHIVFDEFQEISELKNSPIEGIFRRHIQEQQASYFFVGSRRRILLDMFNRKNRPFYQSAIIYPLRPLPAKELVSFLVDRFKAGGKSCPIRVAEKISGKVFQYPYYAQALAYNIFEIVRDIVTEDDIQTGFNNMLASERYGYEAMVQGLTGPQVALLKALAIDPVSKILSTEYMNRHRLSAGGIQYARNKLESLDLIEKYNNVWKIVDPVFACWLAGY